MAILKIKQILDDLKDGTHVAVPDSTANLTVTLATSSGYSGTALKATSAGNAGTALKATSAGYAGTAQRAAGTAGTLLP